MSFFFFFFFNDTATTEIYTLSLHDALPIDRTTNSVPILGHLGGREHILYGVGWSGNGVGPSVVGGKVLASLALGRRDEWSENRLIDRTWERFPPEPVRYLGGHAVREAVIRKERAERSGRQPS